MSLSCAYACAASRTMRSSSRSCSSSRSGSDQLKVAGLAEARRSGAFIERLSRRCDRASIARRRFRALPIDLGRWSKPLPSLARQQVVRLSHHSREAAMRRFHGVAQYGRDHAQSGLSLVELLMGLAIFGLLMGLGVPSYRDWIASR